LPSFTHRWLERKEGVHGGTMGSPVLSGASASSATSAWRKSSPRPVTIRSCARRQVRRILSTRCRAMEEGT
jgi:hypothetical protein